MLGDGLASGLVCGGGGLGEAMDAAMDVGIDPLVVISGRIEDGEGFLGGSGIIEVDEGATIDFLIENRKFRPKLVGIESAHVVSVMPQRQSRKLGWIA